MSSFIMPAAGRISQGFGENPSYYKQYGQIGHSGIDIACPVGTPVKASENGVIHFEGYGQNSPWMGSIAGICCIIDHGSVYTGYAHLTSTVINNRDAVSKGQLIGYSGMTGVGTGPHLHFKFIAKPVNINNGYYGRVNPSQFLSNNATAKQVQQLYQEILERPADDGGIATYTKHTVEFVRADLLRSDEYKRLQASKIVPEPIVIPPVIVEEPQPEPEPVIVQEPVVKPVEQPKDIVITSDPNIDNLTWRYKTWFEKLIESII